MRESLKNILIPGTDVQVVDSYATLVHRAKTKTFGLMEPDVVIFDTETTGLSFDNDELIEIAAAKMHGPEIIEHFQTFIHPRKKLSKEISDLTGITPDMLEGAPFAAEAVASFAQFAGDCPLIAHNDNFDRHFIRKGAAGTDAAHLPQGKWIDSLALSRVAFPRFTSHRLSDLAKAFELHTPTHRATDDVETLCQLWRLMLVALSDFPEGLLKEIAAYSPSTPWEIRSVLVTIAQEDVGSKYFDLKRHRAKCIDAVAANPRVTASDLGRVEFPCDSELEQLFSKDGVLGAMYKNFEPRKEQLEMTCAVSNAFATESNCVIEAGTGVGKSIAYLLPAAIGARKNNITIGVATKSNTLTDQLMFHELPLLQDALAKTQPEFSGPGRELRYTALKGFEHYPCLRKVRALTRHDDLSTEQLQTLASLMAFIAQTPWGDLDSVNIPSNSLNELPISTTSNECLKRHCPFYPAHCYMHGNRRQASSSDIVVTNHALLFCDLVCDGGVLPPIEHWIVDEAHSVEDEARRQLSVTIDARQCMALFNDLIGQGGTLQRIRKTLNGASSSAKEQLPGIDQRAKVEHASAEKVLAYALLAQEQTEHAQTLATSFFSFVKDLAPFSKSSASFDTNDVWVNEEVRESGPWGVVASCGNKFAQTLETLKLTCVDLISAAEQTETLKEESASLANICCGLQEAYEGLVTMIDDPSQDYVYSARINSKPEVLSEKLSAERYDIGKLLVSDFYPRTKSVVYCSATLTTAGSFDRFAQGVSDEESASAWGTVALGSSYDFDKNMHIYVPSDMPTSKDLHYRDALERLLFGVHTTLGGSVLTLFTSRQEMEYQYNKLKDRLASEGIEIKYQARGTSRKVLRDEFISNKKLSLFALKSFWEGFDAPGDTLRCVVIPKLPFAVPTEPLAQERSLREKNAWKKYQLPEAVIALKQAAGRLIRTSSDHGFLVLADARLLTMDYGTVFLDSMPTKLHSVMPMAEMFKDMSGREQ